MYSRGGVFISNKFKDFCDESGIKGQYTIANTAQQNGVPKMQNRSVQQMDKVMMHEINIPKTYWEEAIHTTINILRKEHLRPNIYKAPYKLWHGK